MRVRRDHQTLGDDANPVSVDANPIRARPHRTRPGPQRRIETSLRHQHPTERGERLRRRLVIGQARPDEAAVVHEARERVGIRTRMVNAG